ncbi:DgyrCDS3157 [Dimorphilus gyrociliatus]|uniref:DgyrCDS3157 n=1 Tax=Dimorphilus gyrociliatus TaxID=2664684 RepID=A0A7I8VFC5_9ANNE|nr:DgyrCDS3157 [Dimorphilus gyrociliatus]
MFRNDILWTNRKQATLDQHVVIYEENNYDCKPNCYHFYILVSLRSLLWTFLSISAAILVVSSTLTPDWLIAPPSALSVGSNTSGSKTVWKRQTIGLIFQCSAKVQFDKLLEICKPVHANVNWAWKSCILLLGASSLLLTVTAISSVISICVKSICRKSIFTLTGLVQSIAGLLLVVGIVLFPAGWGSDANTKICGDGVSPFYVGACQLGWASYAIGLATIIIFGAAALSMYADSSTSTDQAEREILNGHRCICLI